MFFRGARVVRRDALPTSMCVGVLLWRVCWWLLDQGKWRIATATVVSLLQNVVRFEPITERGELGSDFFGSFSLNFMFYVLCGVRKGVRKFMLQQGIQKKYGKGGEL